MKRLLLIHLLFTALVLSCGRNANCQREFEQFYLRQEWFADKLDQLRTQYGKNKTIPPEIELEALVALSFFPELSDTRIEFRFRKIGSTMVSRPSAGFMFTPIEKRKYVILVNSSRQNLSWSDLSFNACAGWIAHELAHIVQYNEKRPGGIFLTAILYAFPGAKRKFEHEAYRITIEHDLGFALYEGMHYVFCCSKAGNRYKQYLEKYYLSPDEIAQYTISTRLASSRKE